MDSLYHLENTVWKMHGKYEMPDHLVDMVKDAYRPYTRRLERMLGRKFENWNTGLDEPKLKPLDKLPEEWATGGPPEEYEPPVPRPDEPLCTDPEAQNMLNRGALDDMTEESVMVSVVFVGWKLMLRHCSCASRLWLCVLSLSTRLVSAA